MKVVKIRGKEFLLDHRRAVYVKDDHRLILADLHIGKSSHFRKAGYSLPSYSFKSDLDRLMELYHTYQPREILILGDLYHSDFNEEFITWHHEVSKRISSQFHLIVGNHDRLTMKRNELLKDFAINDTYEEGTFFYSHYPTEKDGLLNVCGHIHPGVRLQGSGQQRMKIACFWLSSDQLVLPAFSELTGLGVIKPDPNDKIFACAQKEVIALIN